MNEVLNDIEDLNTAIILLKEGASDEKQQGITMLQNMVTAKERQFKEFEKQLEFEIV